MDAFTKLFNDFDRGRISRRRLLQTLGMAAVAAPMSALGQGSCYGDRANTPQCSKKLWDPPFEPTGWKTVLLDHFSLQVAELDKEAAYYNALMGWKVRSNDGKKIVLDIGNIGGVVMRGGLPLPPPAPYQAPPTGMAAAAATAQNLATQLAGLAAADANAGGRGAGGNRGGGGGAAAGGGRGGAAGAAGANAAGGGQRGGGGGAGGGGGRGGPNAPTRAIWDGFAFGIEPWDTNKVEAELKRRGLNPVADHDAKNNYFSFHVKDPDGFDLALTNGNKTNRRNTPANGELNMALPFEATGWQTVYLDHISFGVSNYKETVAFYTALIGWKGLGDEGSQNETVINPEIGGLLIRGANALDPAFKMPSPRRASMGHIAFGLANFDPDKVQQGLISRGLPARIDTGYTSVMPDSEKDIHTSTYKSFHTQTPNGYDLQISNHTSVSQTLG